MANWLRSLRQTTTYLGVAVIAILWVGIYLLASQEHDNAYRDAVRQSGNISRVLEEYIRRVVQESDGALLELRRDYQADPQHFDLAAWASRGQMHNDLTVQFGIADAAGFVTQSSLRALASPVYVGNRAPFLDQRDGKTDRLYISDPIVGNVSKRLTLEFARRVTDPDGSFAGVVVSSFDVDELENFFSSLDLGKSGVVALVGTDGVLLARGGQNPASREIAGISILHSALFSHLAHSTAETYWNDSASQAKFDGVARLMSYRRLAGMPLIAVVGLAKADIFQQADATLSKYVIIGTVLTLIILIVLLFGAAQQAHILAAAAELRRSKQSLEQSNHLLNTALTNMAHGLCMFDRDQRLVVCNRRYGEMYGLGPEQLQRGTTLRSILEARQGAGTWPIKAAQNLDTRLRQVAQRHVHSTEDELQDGRIYAISHQPMPDGGWVATHIDITEQRRAEKSLEHSNLLLNTALKHMAHGLCMFDRDQRLVICNTRYGEMYGLAEEDTKPGTTLRSILEARVRAGVSPEGSADYVRNRLDEVAKGEPYYVENVLRDGSTYAVSHRPMSDGGWVATHIDITEQRHAEQELGETRRFLDSIIEQIPVSVVVKDVKTRKYLLVNRAFETMLGIPRDRMLDRTSFDIHRALDAKNIDDADTESLRDADHVNYKEIEINTTVRGPRMQSTRRIVIKGADGEPKYIIAVIEDVTEQKKAEQRIAFLAHHDALTGLANRAALIQKIEEAAARQRRLEEPFTLLLLDLDRFKQVNDTLGHPAGDALLVEVATRLRSLLRETDVLARLGGDEFAVIQSGESDQREAAKSLAERIIAALGQPFDIDGGNIGIGTSIGIALAAAPDSGADDLLKMADLALYRAKSSGRNGYSFFAAEMSEIASARQEIESDLRRAIQNGEFELHYQPIVDSRTRRLCSVEALVRWRHPTKGLVYPDLFIPLAEETGLITQIGEWVLRSACAEAATWPGECKLAVNLSLVQFRKSNLPDVVLRALVDSGLRPDRLELEITETALIESAAECLPALRQFKSMGITIVLDDFGTGYSSLSQLAMFPFDKIKIDKSFTQNLTKRSECAAIVSATLTLAQSLDIATTAEGVETVDQYRLLRLAGVTFLQGYLFKRPGPASEIDFSGAYGGVALENAA
ncbi:MAG TPA: EAL domain-containing protein [Xanthobacteraceae bacterium]|jgi:diguanylate cyclase (GGDEF)-like protein/PAS domain S-box-containing protein|nr:EAL domain-containing protein [Xanthobacteraceae bacterium]